MIETDPRIRWLTEKQKHIVELARKDGYVALKEITLIYSSKQNWERAIHRLIDFNLLRPSKDGMTYYYIPFLEGMPQKTLFDTEFQIPKVGEVKNDSN